MEPKEERWQAKKDLNKKFDYKRKAFEFLYQRPQAADLNYQHFLISSISVINVPRYLWKQNPPV